MDAPIVTIRLAGVPQGKGRARVMRRGDRLVAVTPDRTRNFEGALRLAAARAMGGRPPLDGQLDVLMHAVFPIAPSWPKRRQQAAREGRLRPTSKPDWDNIAKTCDALNQVVFSDDAKIVDGTVRKFYGDRPELVIEVRMAGAA